MAETPRSCGQGASSRRACDGRARLVPIRRRHSSYGEQGSRQHCRVAQAACDGRRSSEPPRADGGHLSRAAPLAPEGAASALRRLQEHGIGLGIVSNRGAIPGRFVMRYLEANGLAGFFDPAAVIWSDEVGFSKPDPRIYLTCLRALGVPPERAAHVGDHKVKDVAGARQLGMTTIRYAGVRDDHDDGPEADTVILHYRELPPALGFSAYGDCPSPSTPHG